MGKILIRATKKDVHCNIYGRLSLGKTILIDEKHFDCDYMEKVDTKVVSEDAKVNRKKGGKD